MARERGTLSKKRHFSVYLLKETFTADNSLRSQHGLNELGGSNVPADARIFVLDAPDSVPWWKGYLGIADQVRQARKAAVLFLPAGGRTFVLTFGLVHYCLLDESIEHDFGLRVTLNCVDPKALRSTDTLDPGDARRKRTQMPVGSDLTYFDFDRDSSVVKSITGRASEQYQDLFKHVTGGSSLSIEMDCEANDLPDICAKLLVLYDAQNYKSNFPELHNIVPVQDPSRLANLNANLTIALRDGNDKLYLVVPEIVDYSSGIHYVAFTGEGPSLLYSDVHLGSYAEYLELNGKTRTSLSFEDVTRQGINLCDETEQKRKHYTIFRCLVFETNLDSDSHTYNLTDGKWYEVDNAFIQQLKTRLDPLCVDMGMPDFTHEDESEYSVTVAAQDPSFFCLDKKNISPSGQTQVEPCDLFRLEGSTAALYHVKRSTVSAQLSHLFNQGVVSLELLRTESVAVEKLKEILADMAPGGVDSQIVSAIDSGNFGIRFVVITHKDPANKSENLPLFSKITLNRVSKYLEIAHSPCQISFANDVANSAPPKKKTKKSKLLTPIGNESASVINDQ